MPIIYVVAATATQQSAAKTLAQTLGLPYTADLNDAAIDYVLILTPTHLGLQPLTTSSQPLVVDFLSKQMTYRRKQVSLKREALARALGLKGNTAPTIVDLTAGLGRDSFILACLGFSVTLLERSPIIHALLADGIQRAQHDPGVGAIVNRLQLINIDAMTWLQQLTPATQPDIIYLDPMFPERTKSALVKKEMRIFHDIAGNGDDAAPLLTLALACARKRVVVKRPRLAPPLANHIPSFSQTGSSCRFDIYLR